jgi:hypothetical protein
MEIHESIFFTVTRRKKKVNLFKSGRQYTEKKGQEEVGVSSNIIHAGLKISLFNSSVKNIFENHRNLIISS